MNLVWVLAAAAVATGSDYLLKRWSLTDATVLLVGGVVGWALSAFLFACSLRTGTLLANGSVFVVASGLAVVAMSLWVFHEPVSPRQWAGVALAVVAVLLLDG